LSFTFGPAVHIPQRHSSRMALANKMAQVRQDTIAHTIYWQMSVLGLELMRKQCIT
jgi:hypothetical protein